MAARRLVAVLIVLLVLSTIVAILLPAPREPIGGDSTTTTSTLDRRGRPGRLVTRTFAAWRSGQAIRLQVGDELQLEVKARRPDQAEIRGLGLVEAVDAETPADFDVFAERPGRYPVELLEARRAVGEIRVTRGAKRA